MSLEKFLLWSPLALKNFLQMRKKSIDGSFQELASRAFVAWEENIEVDVTKEQLLRSNLAEYKERLKICDTVIPDPFTLQDGWIPESECAVWPSLYFSDIAEYLRMNTDQELHYRLCNEYKQGKAYRYFSSGWVQEIRYHPISPNSTVCILSTRVTPSMRTSMPPYQVWVVTSKDTPNSAGGAIYGAYCTCTAGLNGTCNHIAALLFRVEYIVRTGFATSTSRPCVWDKPALQAFKPSIPVRLCEQKWKKGSYLGADVEDYHESVLDMTQVFTPLSATQEKYATAGDQIRLELATVLRDDLPDSCFQNQQ